MTKNNLSQSHCQGVRSRRPLIVLGYDARRKPQAAQFPAADANLVAKAARLYGPQGL